MASFIACIWTQNSSSALTALCCCWTLNTIEPLSVTAAWSRVVSTSAAIFFITNWWMSKSLKVWIMTWKLARSKPGRGRAEMQGSSVPLGRNHVSPSGGPLPSWALRIVLTFPPFTAPLVWTDVLNRRHSMCFLLPFMTFVLFYETSEILGKSETRRCDINSLLCQTVRHFTSPCGAGSFDLQKKKKNCRFYVTKGFCSFFRENFILKVILIDQS